MVAYVSVSAPRGGTGDDSLDPLLRLRQGGLFTPMELRQDVATLFRAGEFSQVEAWVEPWPVELPGGEMGVGVRVEYQVWAAPRLVRTTVTGVRALAPAALLGELGVAVGNPWSRAETDGLAARVEAVYRARGWPAAVASVRAEADDDGDVHLVVQVEEGAAQLVREIKVRPNAALSADAAQALLARHGLRVGRPWTDAALRAAQEALTTRLHAWPSGVLGWRRTWWPEARVNLKLAPHPDGGDRLSVLIEERRPWTLRHADPTDRPRLPSEADLVATMGLDQGARLSRDFATEASARLSEEAALAGWMDARIEVRVKEGDDGVAVEIDGDRGPRYAVRAARYTGAPVDPDAIGASSRGGISGCHVDPPHEGEARAVAADRRRVERFLCQATEESAAEVLPKVAFAPQTITPEVADRAAAALEEFLRSQGYLGVSVERTGWAPAAPGRRRRDVTLTYALTTGPRAVLRGVEVRGSVPGVVPDDVFADLLDEPVNPNTVADRARRLVELHRAQGFLHADAQVQSVPNADGTEVRVTVAVAPGPVVQVRSVVVRGHSRTRRATIERAVEINPGDPVSPAELAALRAGLYELGVFSRVSVDPVGDEDRVKDVVITVAEKPNLAFEVGGGLATDNGAAVFARAGHRNLWGLAHRLTLYGQAGVGWVGDGWTVDWLAPEWKAALRYEAPDLPTQGERVSIDVLLNEEQQERTWRLQRSGGGIGVRLRLGKGATAELGYRAQLRRLLDVDPGVLVAGDAWTDELQIVDTDDPEPVLPSAGRWASGIEASFVLDLRDDLVNPTRGGLGALAVRVNDDLLSDLAYVKVDGSWTQLVPVGGVGLVLRARGGAAAVPSEDASLPIEDRFRAGGGGSFRGFDIDQVGPANYVGDEHVDWPEALAPLLDYSQRNGGGRWVTTGGDAMAVGTVEVNVPFSTFGLANWSSWQLAFFADAGNVWWIDPDVIPDSAARGGDPAVRFGTGFGIRRATPIGPLQVDLGFNPAALEYREEPLYRFHFAVGAI